MALLMKQMIITLIVQLSLIITSSISLSECDQTTKKITSNNISNSITIDLHHLDLSSISPRYDPSSSHYQRVANALQRSSAHANAYLQASKQTPAAAPIIENNGGNYFLIYSIGSPSVALQGILDTGSDLIWTSCSNVSGSTSLKPITCDKTSQCNTLLPGSTTACSQGRCSYQMTYGDGSSSAGYLSTDTITLDSVQFPNITFGCGTKNYLSDGVVGLGGGAVSLVKQIGYGQFSYCLVSFDSKRSTSKLHLGDSAAVVQGAASIPLVIDSQNPTFYNVKLASITVGGGQIPFGQNMILDTGTGATRLPVTFHSKLLNALRTSIGTNNVTDPNGGPFGLCYSSDPADKFPDITLNFDNNVGVKWKQENVFAKLGPVIVWCFAAYPIDDRQEAIFGNLAQVNYLVGFDLNKNAVTIQPTDCGSSN